MVTQLVSFGNFMIGQLYAEWLDNPQAGKDFNAWLRKRETTLADLQRWETENPGMYEPTQPHDHVALSDNLDSED